MTKPHKLPRVPVTGGAEHWPIVDRFGQRLYVGDRVRAQCCVGPYGQTCVIEATVTEAHWPLCQLNPPAHPRCVIDTTFDHAHQILRCARTHRDVEHGHDTWAEVRGEPDWLIVSRRRPRTH
jgi:hypothetical protein